MSPLYTPGKLTLRQTWQPMDPDAAAYITAVETADGQALEEKVKIAIDNFVLGCKTDGIWSAIKASCILAGARTLAGALVPLVGTAPTNFNFVAGDYNRETGLVGDGSTKYLDSNRNNNADPQNNRHVASYVGQIPLSPNNGFLISSGSYLAPGSTYIFKGVPDFNYTSAKIAGGIEFGPVAGGPNASGLYGVSRSSSSSATFAFNKSSVDYVSTSQTPSSSTIRLFSDGTTLFSTARLAFYSIGESLDLASLDARVTDLINAIGVAIP